MPAFAGVPLYQIWTTLHVPAISVPVFKGPAGMPIGAQLIATTTENFSPAPNGPSKS